MYLKWIKIQPQRGQTRRRMGPWCLCGREKELDQKVLWWQGPIFLEEGLKKLDANWNRMCECCQGNPLNALQWSNHLNFPTLAAAEEAEGAQDGVRGLRTPSINVKYVYYIFSWLDLVENEMREAPGLPPGHQGSSLLRPFSINSLTHGHCLSFKPGI